MARIRADYVFGTLSAGIDADDTTLSSSALSRLPAVSGGDVAAITLHDPETGVYEIVHVTAHSASATTATILRGQEGSTAQAWAADTVWLHGSTAADFHDADGGGGGGVPAGGTTGQMLAKNSATDYDTEWVDPPEGGGTAYGILDWNSYNTDSQVTYTPTTTMADIDATNASVTFTVPDSGAVYVRFEAAVNQNAQAGFLFCLREGSSEVPKTRARRNYYVGLSAGGQLGTSVTWIVSGLTPGSVHTYKVAFMKNGTGTTSTIMAGGQVDTGYWGPMTTVVSALPL